MNSPEHSSSFSPERRGRSPPKNKPTSEHVKPTIERLTPSVKAERPRPTARRPLWALIREWFVAQTNVTGSGPVVLLTDPDGSLRPRRRGATMTYGRGGGRNDRWVRGGKQAANARLEVRFMSSPDAGPSFRAESGVTMDKIKVLLFAANPRGTAPLDLPREFREIDEEVRLGTFRDARSS